MKKKRVFRKIALLLTITLIVNLGVFDVFSFDSKADGTTLEVPEGHEYTCETDVTISDNVIIHNSGKLTINSDASLTINGNVTVQGTIINNGQLTINGNINILGGNYTQVSKGAVVNSEGAIATFHSITSNSFTTGNYLNPTTQTYVDNKGTVEVKEENSTSNVKNSGNGMLIYNREYYNTDNLDLDISISGTKSAVDDTKYIGSVTITPPSGFKITTDNPANYSSMNEFWDAGADWKNSIVINSSQPVTDYWLKVVGGDVLQQTAYTQVAHIPAITIRTSADEPTGKPYVITNPDSKEGNFYWTYVGVKPAAGYTELDFYNENGRQFSANQSSEHEFRYTTRGEYSVKLKDADGFYTNSYALEDLNIIQGDPFPFEVTGDFFDETSNGIVYATGAKIQGREGYKVILAEDYQANNNAAGSDEINITKTKRNVKIYLKASGDNVWLGPIELGDMVIGLETPSNPYTISGSKYKDKFYDSDVEIIPAEGYKITTSKDKEPTDKLKLTKTTKDLKIYLVKVRTNSDHIEEAKAYTDPISVGDIYILREGEGKVTVNDLFYGGRVIPVVSTKTNDIKKVSYKYKKADGGDYLKEVPSEIGKYVVEATFEMTDDYKELVVKDEFEISYLPAPATPYTLQGTLGDNNIYTTDVKVLPADGYKISTTIKTGYTDSIDLDKNGDIGYVYLQKVSTGEMTDKIAIKEILIDKEEPVVTGIKDKEVIYTDSKQIIVKDDNLFEVTVNGVKVAVSNGQAVIDLSSDNGIMDYTIVMTDKAGHKSEIFVTLITAWMKEGNVQEGVPLKLYPGYTYNFPEGSTWTIEGDPTVYKGGNKFVVNNNVEIKFKKN